MEIALGADVRNLSFCFEQPPTAFLPFGWLTHSIAVIPAKAGIQVVNDRARFVGEPNTIFCGLLRLCSRFCVACGDAYLWVADPREFMERALCAQ